MGNDRVHSVHKDFDIFKQVYQMGASFEALDELVFMAPLDFLHIS